MDKIRAFIAISLPPELTDRLTELQDALKKGFDASHVAFEDKRHGRGRPVSWTRPSGIHLTLKFLGDIDSDAIDAIAAALERAAKDVRPFTLTSGGDEGGRGADDPDESGKGEGGRNDPETDRAPWLGGFPGLNNPRVVFTCLNGSPELQTLQENIEREIEGLGFDRDNRPFRPHLTLCRIRSAAVGRAIGEAALEVDAGEAITFTVNSFELIKSVLGRGGAAYTVLRRIELKKDID
jgi:2'-5' RNA ligase